MSAPVCKNCRGPVEDLRHGYATPVCFACLKPSWQEAEIARLRAALQSIAALQATKPEDPSYSDAYRMAGGDPEGLFHAGHGEGFDSGCWTAAEMARVALRGGK